VKKHAHIQSGFLMPFFSCKNLAAAVNFLMMVTVP